MSLSPYSGNPAGPSGTGVQLAFNLPTDGDNWTASEFNAFNQQSADNIACLATSLNNVVTSRTAMRALPVPVNPNGLAYVLLTPELNGLQVGDGGLYASLFSGTYIGGIYYYDAFYTAVGNETTCIQPTAITGSNPGRWRLQGGPLFTVWDQYYDSTLGNNGSTTPYTISAAPSDGNARGLTRTGTGPNFYSINLGTGTGPQSIYLGDIIDVEAEFFMSAANGSGGTDDVDSGFTWLMNPSSSGGVVTGTRVGATAKATVQLATLTNALVTVPGRFRYIVQASDITAGTLSFQPTFFLNSGSVSAVGAELRDLKMTIRRP